MELPPPLAPWREYLWIFPREVAGALGPLVRRLDLAIGPLRAHRLAGAGDPDGFAGLTRRGPYERLLMSEWLLIDEAPLEFARRAAMGEHAFLELARRQPAGARRSAAIFDAGPNQQGSPRLTHLAALIVLARRAAAAGAAFEWGIAQRPGQAALSEVTPATIRRLLEARTPREATPRDLEAWRERLGPVDSLSDRWLVGGARLSEWVAGWGGGFLEAADPLDPGVCDLEVAVIRPGAPPTRVRLPLPPDADAARLLRDPFHAAAVMVRPVLPSRTPASNLLFPPGGNRLLARTARNDLLSYAIPNSPRGQGGRPKLLEPRFADSIVAAGRVRRSTAAVSLSADRARLRVQWLGRGNTHQFPSGEFWLPAPLAPLAELSSTLLTPCVALGDAHSPTIDLLILVAGTLVRLRADGGEQYVASIEATGVSDLAWAPPHGAAYLSHAGGPCFFTSMTADEAKPGRGFEFSTGRGLFGFSGPGAWPVAAGLAVEQSDGQWLLVRDAEEWLFAPPSGTTVVGPMRSRRGFPGLIVLEADRRSLTLLAREGSFPVTRATDAIPHATVSAHAGRVAWVTTQGEVAVYSMEHEEMLYRLTVEPPA